VSELELLQERVKLLEAQVKDLKALLREGKAIINFYDSHFLSDKNLKGDFENATAN